MAQEYKNKTDVEGVYDMTDDVTASSGYTFEGRQTKRIFGGWGGMQTKLPEGHMARRDTPTTARELKPGKK